MLARMWTKNDTQGFISRLRKAGYRVDRIDGGYVCHAETEYGTDLVFQAMIGSRGYLCRISEKYVSQDNCQ